MITDSQRDLVNAKFIELAPKYIGEQCSPQMLREMSNKLNHSLAEHVQRGEFPENIKTVVYNDDSGTLYWLAHFTVHNG